MLHACSWLFNFYITGDEDANNITGLDEPVAHAFPVEIAALHGAEANALARGEWFLHLRADGDDRRVGAGVPALDQFDAANAARQGVDAEEDAVTEETQLHT